MDLRLLNFHTKPKALSEENLFNMYFMYIGRGGFLVGEICTRPAWHKSGVLTSGLLHTGRIAAAAVLVANSFCQLAEWTHGDIHCSHAKLRIAALVNEWKVSVPFSPPLFYSSRACSDLMNLLLDPLQVPLFKNVLS